MHQPDSAESAFYCTLTLCYVGHCFNLVFGCIILYVLCLFLHLTSVEQIGSYILCCSSKWRCLYVTSEIVFVVLNMEPVLLHRGNITPLIKHFLDFETDEVNLKMLILQEDALKRSMDCLSTNHWH